jgi:hypothetical protein
MKKLAFPVLALFATAVACNDSTAPKNVLTVKPPTLAITGRAPPPPVDAVIQITVASTPVTGFFTGMYFANGASVPGSLAAQEIGDPVLAFDGTAWLRLDNKQAFGSTASANARFQITHDNLSGKGTLVIEGQIITIDRVTSFIANPDCKLTPGDPCAVITFDASVNGESGHHGTAEAFDREFCDIFTGDGTFISCPGDEGGC